MDSSSPTIRISDTTETTLYMSIASHTHNTLIDLITIDYQLIYTKIVLFMNDQ